MSMKSTVKIRAPREVVDTWRLKFPGIRDADIVRFMWQGSLLRIEAGLRDNHEREIKKKYNTIPR